VKWPFMAKFRVSPRAVGKQQFINSWSGSAFMDNLLKNRFRERKTG